MPANTITGTGPQPNSSHNKFKKIMINIVTLDTKKAIELLLMAEYQKEWEVIDRMNQHPRGINFYEWLFEKKLIKEWEFKKIQAQIKAEDLED